jgi:hypothetical protein
MENAIDPLDRDTPRASLRRTGFGVYEEDSSSS